MTFRIPCSHHRAPCTTKQPDEHRACYPAVIEVGSCARVLSINDVTRLQHLDTFGPYSLPYHSLDAQQLRRRRWDY